MPDSPSPNRRGWIEALVATALRWNDRLSRPIGGPTPPRSEASTPASAARSGSARTVVPLSGSGSK